MDALIVAIETQADHLEKKKTWTRKIVLITDGENPIEVEEWEQTADKMNALGVNLVVVWVQPVASEMRLTPLAVESTLTTKNMALKRRASLK